MESELITIIGQCPGKSRHYRVGVLGGKNVKARGHMYKSTEFKDWEKDFKSQLGKFRNPKIKGEFEIGLVVTFKTYLSDIDNALKGILDCLEDEKWIDNDKMCMKVVIEKRVSNIDPKIIFKIKTF